MLRFEGGSLIGATAALVLALAAGGGPSPDLYFEQTTVTSLDGRSAGPGVHSKAWYSGRKMRLEAGDAGPGHAFVLRLDEGRAWRLDPEQNVAVEVDLERLRARSHQDVSMAGDLMGASEEGAARTAPLRGRKVVAGHHCRGYRISAPSVVMEVYLSQEVPVGIEAFAEFLEWSGASQSLAGVLSEVRRLKGFPLETLSRVTVLGRVHETRSTVTLVKVGPHPASLFLPPAGYRIVAEPPSSDQ